MNSMKRTMTCSARENSDLVVVEAAQQDAVDLDGAEAGVLGGADAVADTLEAARNARDAGEGVWIDGVHAHGNAGEAGVLEWLGQRREEMAVGSEGDVEWCGGVRGLELGGFADEVEQALAEGGFAAGEANFFNAQRNEDAQDAGVVGQGQLGEGCAVVARAAVNAAVVAAVGDGEPEVGQDAAVAVGEARCAVREKGGRGDLEDGKQGGRH
jgi:hypothetical protein